MPKSTKPPKLPALPEPRRLAPRLPLQTLGQWNNKRAILHLVAHLAESEAQKRPDLRYCGMECLAKAVLGLDTDDATVEARGHVQSLIRHLNAYEPTAPLLLVSRAKFARLVTVHFDTGQAADRALAYYERMRVVARATRATELADAMKQKQAHRPALVSPI